MESWWNDPCSRKLLSPKRAMGCPLEAARRIRAMGVAECCGLEVRIHLWSSTSLLPGKSWL